MALSGVKSGRPLQILDFQTVDGKKRLVLNEENLQKILKPVEDLPIAFISITGASRQGKSFLLSFMVRYLEALKIEESDWMGWDNSKEALVGFKWRDGINPETSGMWLWSEAFVVNSNDRKVAIILMDTQGTFDDMTTQREWSTIVGLSMLTSSCTIFNCLGNFQEDVLNTLESYIQYGIQAMEQDGMDETRPFQKLMFLIRDWSMPSVYSYGAKGGEKFLEEKLKVKPESQPEQAQRVRKTLKTCFESVECFLMPDPGERAKEINFTGAIAQLSDKFAKRVEAFVSDLLNPDEIPIKTVFGNDMVGLDLLHYFAKYIEIFNGDDMPSPMSVFEATARLNNQAMVNKSKRVYIENMKKKLRGNNYLSEKNFKAAHSESLRKSNDSFRKAKKIGSTELVSEFEEIFDKAVGDEYKALLSNNTMKIEKEVLKAKEAKMNEYKEKMNEEYPPEEFCEEKKLLGFSSNCIAKLLEEFEEKFIDLDDKVEDLVCELKEKLGLEQTFFQNQNSIRRSQADLYFKNFIDEIIDKYSEMMREEYDANETMSKDDMETIHTESQEKCSTKFKTADRKGDRNFMATYKNIFETSLEERHIELIDSFTAKQEQKRIKCENLISSLVTEFKDEMLKQIEITESDEYLRVKYSELLPDILTDFEAKQEYHLGSEIFKNFESSLKIKLESTFEHDVTEKFKLKMKESESSFTNAYDAALAAYKQEMESLLSSAEFQEDNDLQTQHQASLQSASKIFTDAPKTGRKIEIKSKEMLEKLEEEIKETNEKYAEQNSLKKSNIEQKSQNDVTECVKEYQTEMRQSLELARDETRLKEMHTKALASAIKLFQNKCPIKTDDFVHKYIDSIEEQIEETYEEIVELYTLKMEEQSSGTEKALIDARRYYHEEMAKHYSNSRFMRPCDLEKLHKTVSQKSVNRCCQSAPLTQNQQEDLLSSLGVTYKQYEEDNDKNVPVDPAIGIDLGTTYCCVAVYYNGKTEVIPNKEGKKTTPSYVAFKDGVQIVGEAAKNQAHENPENTIFDAKRIIGRRMDDEKLQKDCTMWPFTVVEENGIPKVEAEGKTYFPEQISAEMLKEMRVNAEAYLQRQVTKAVITVPAYFTDGQRQATIDAGELAGLEVLMILNEPTAAAIAYKLQHMDNDSRNVLIFDLGGGTFDVAVLEMSKGVIDVKAVDGDTHLGGEDFDNNMVEHCALDFQQDTGIDILEGRSSGRSDVRVKSLKAMRRVRNESERRKIDLASSKRVEIVVDSVDAGHDLKVVCTRDEFENMNESLFKKTIEIVERVLLSSGKSKTDIDDIVLVGGSTRIPKIQEMLVNYFDGKALSKNINPDEAVAVGAAIQAAILNGKIAKESNDFNTILDVTPFSIGVEVLGGDMSVIIPKNSRIPCSVDDSYRTAHNNQTSVQVIIFQGEKPVAADNTKLGEFYLNGIPPADAGRENVKVKMEINQQGVLNVKAICSSNGVTNTGLTINEQKWRMGKETIKKILAEGKIAGAQGGLSSGD